MFEQSSDYDDGLESGDPLEPEDDLGDGIKDGMSNARGDKGAG